MHYLYQLYWEGFPASLLQIQPQNHGVCGSYQAGKHHQTLFLDGDYWQASKVLLLVHTNFCGPMNTPSITGYKYLLFVDVFSGKMWVYFLRNKSNVFNTFQQFKALVKKESDSQIVSL